MAQTLRKPSSPPLKTSPPKQPPTPAGHFFFGSSLENTRNALKLACDAWRVHGDAIRFKALPWFYWYQFTHPDAVEHILHRHQQNFAKPPFFNKTMALVTGNGILVSEGATWLKHRRMMQPSFNRQQLAGLGSVMSDCASQLADTWDSLPDGTVIETCATMMQLTLRIAGLTLFSTDITGESGKMGQAFRTTYEYFNYRINHQAAPPEWFPTRRNREFTAARSYLDRVVFDIINQRRENPEAHPDMLSRLMNARDEETGHGLSDAELRNEVLTLLIAGHETVATALTWAWYLLGLHPHIADAVYDEVSAVLGGRTPTVDDLPNLPYTRMVFDEVLRLYPPAWGLPRYSLADDEVNGFFLPKGSVITLAQYITHRHPDFWDHPEAFIPERFDANHSSGRPKFAYFPFGGGQRYCIGNHFALMEGPLLLATLIQRFRLELLPNQWVEMDPTFTLKPKNGLYATLRKRV